MRLAPLAALMIFAATACVQAPPAAAAKHRVPAAAAPSGSASPAAETPPRARSAVDSPATTLDAFEVRESAFSDFGMSVKTNFGVRWGGNVEWMIVTGVERGSSAARAEIAVGDKILAIDGHQLSELSRDAMLDLLFQRKKGDRSRLLVLGPRNALPRFVTLVANRP